VRINKYLALNLNTSRREADKLIKKKLIKINGLEAELGQLVDKNDVLTYKNEVINSITEHKYYKFYKPKNYTSSRTSQGNSKTMYELINNKNLKYSGRLDKDSEGLMLLSTDGDWLNINAHPSKEVSKKYIVTTDIEDIDLAIFQKRINDNKEKLMLYSMNKIKKYQYAVTLKTGKNREIRRIFEYNNVKITNLKRISIGKQTLGNMKIGELKEIKK
jgi:pseudouridine synthase